MTGWPAQVQVVTPTVPARRTTREATLDQWRELGADPIVIEQDERLPYSHDSGNLTARRALHAGLDTRAEWILHAEDDIDVDPEITTLWPLLLREIPVSLWHRPRFAPRGACPHPDGEPTRLWWARNPRRWWSSQGILMPRRIAEAVAATPIGGPGGWDLHLRRVWLAHGWMLHLTSPCLVEHRDLPRLASQGGPRRITSGGCYRGPRTIEQPETRSA